MIAYHGTPLGAGQAEVAPFYYGRHALVPFNKQTDLAVVGSVARSFVFDNSAYSVWKSGDVLDVPGFTRWCEEWARHPRLDWCLIPDAIEGTAADNDALLRDWPAHLRHLGVPVYHLHEDVSRMARLVREWTRVAIGSSGAFDPPESQQWWARMEHVMDAACDNEGRPLARLHGLRMLSPRITSAFPFASADSSTAARKSMLPKTFGAYVAPTRAARAATVADHLEYVRVPDRWQRAAADLF